MNKHSSEQMKNYAVNARRKQMTRTCPKCGSSDTSIFLIPSSNKEQEICWYCENCRSEWK